MAVRINLPSAGLLGIAGVQVFRINTATTLVAGNVYILEDAATPAPFTVTLPSTANDGQTILLKRTTGTQTITVAPALIEGTMQPIEITNNQPIRLIYVSESYGWLIT